MPNELNKLKNTITLAPIGAIAGAIAGYLVAKKLGHDKSITVISFTVVGVIIGSAIGLNIKNK